MPAPEWSPRDTRLFVQNLRPGHYELAVDEPVQLRLAVAFDELVMAV
jgi:hypothetical protein